ncbi:hypothetical protein HK105_204845 [Polyrhizophydium stewartii]|uniref:Uncharacterized protein n=1 Tax=Polyrhizophydium stewartii TaxID=2732419 RepID=A0ABR4N827_9FUNG|nr:hypothetical protein HK105_000173 [Polyrhizophydium stewartii]
MPGSSAQAAHTAAFEAHCRTFFDQTVPTGSKDALRLFMTLFDGAAVAGSPAAGTVAAAGGAAGHATVRRLPLESIPPGTPEPLLAQARDIWLACGFAADGRMLFPGDYAALQQIKSRLRLEAHGAGQARRMDALAQRIAALSAPRQSQPHAPGTTAAAAAAAASVAVPIADGMSSTERREALAQFCSSTADDPGSYPFVLGLARMLHAQAHTATASVHWRLDDAVLVESSERLMERAVHVLVAVLGCHVTPPAADGCRVWSLPPWLSRAELARLDLAMHLSDARKRAARSRVRATGTVEMTEIPQMILSSSWGSRIQDWFWLAISWLAHLLVA